MPRMIGNGFPEFGGQDNREQLGLVPDLGERDETGRNEDGFQWINTPAMWTQRRENPAALAEGQESSALKSVPEPSAARSRRTRRKSITALQAENPTAITSASKASGRIASSPITIR